MTQRITLVLTQDGTWIATDGTGLSASARTPEEALAELRRLQTVREAA